MVEIFVRTYKDPALEHQVRIIVFNAAPAEPEVESPAAVQTDNQVLVNLEEELQLTKVRMAEIIEQADTTSEELKASVEEMQAINEELRSASEELETSKEELQSVNEELLTVNHELKIKVEETDKVNDYLSNLISSTEIATVFIDRNLLIRWFAPRATDIFNMLPVDTGRPLLDITHRLRYPQLAGDLSAVYDSLTTMEREVCSTDGRWYIARILPYRSNEDHINGTVLTFIDITKRRQVEHDLTKLCEFHYTHLQSTYWIGPWRLSTSCNIPLHL